MNALRVIRRTERSVHDRYEDTSLPWRQRISEAFVRFGHLVPTATE